MKGLGLASLSGARRDYMPPLLKTKTLCKNDTTHYAFSLDREPTDQ